MIKRDVIILGAGPGGVATALQLAKTGTESMVLDKATFPRDKICGDALSGKVVHTFDKIDKSIFEDFRERDDIKIDSWGIDFIFPKERYFHVPLQKNLQKETLDKKAARGFVTKREDFDDYLVQYIKKESLIDFKENCDIKSIERNQNGFLISDKTGETVIQTKLIIDCMGAQSRFARKVGGIQKEDRYYSGSVRAYYKNVSGFNDFNFIELHFLKEFLPGYLWVFPLPDGRVNVGIAMRTDVISKRKLNLNKEMHRMLKEHPRFKERFADAEMEGKARGFGLPLGSKKRSISGDNYMLVGDAASLIDPLTGEGIGNAAISGRLAAIQAAEAIKANDYSAAFLKQYDKAIYDKLWKEFKLSHTLQKRLLNPFIVEVATRLFANNHKAKELLSSMFDDVDLRKKLSSPKFYFDLILNRS